MNPRIKELYMQAHSVREYPLDDPMRGGNPPTVYWGGEVSADKFAELIVEECRNVVADLYRKTPLELCGPLLQADEEIAKHFYGVAE